jgi:hypothetical protein
MASRGFLAIWTEVEPEHLPEYRRWLSQEHVGQRIFGSGFLGARVCAALDNELAHFILYATESNEVLASQGYVDVLNNPTTWTRRMMPRLKNFDRGAGERVVKVGDGSGAWLLVSRFASLPSVGVRQISATLREMLSSNGVVTLQLFSLDRHSTDIPTQEKTMRSGSEGRFQSLLVIETMTEASLAAVRERLEQLAEALFGANAGHESNSYRFIYGLYPCERGELDVN